MSRTKKFASIVLLIVFIGSNLLESVSYVFAEEIYSLEGNIEETLVDENSDTEEDVQDEDIHDEDISDDKIEEVETENFEEKKGSLQVNFGMEGDNLVVNNGEVVILSDTGANNQEPIENTGANNQEPIENTGANNQEPVENTGANNQEPIENTGANNQEPVENTGANNQEPIENTGANNQELSMDINHWEEGTDFYDIVYTGIVKGRDYTITLMDRNLGATSIDREREESYGYLYQWGNNNPFFHNTRLNKYSNEKVDASGYGPDNWFSGENFIKGNDDWSSVQNDNLWGGEGDSEDNGYNDESNRQGPCPEGYHVPSVGEWHALLSTFFVNNGIDEVTTSGLIYPNYIGKEGKGAYYLDSEYIEEFNETFNISYAGRLIGNGALQRTGTTAHLWTSTPLNDTSLGFEVWNDHINLGGWKTVRVTAYPVRCFKSVEYETVDYTITYIDGEKETTEIKHRGDTLIEPEHTDKGEGYEWLGWYVDGSVFDFTGTQVTGDVTLIAIWECADNYHEEEGLCKSNTKIENCIQTGKVENSSYVVTGMIITWDITGAKWNEIPVCEWTCLDNYHLTGGQCESNTKIENCIQTGKVENSSYIVTGMIIAWDITGAKWNEIPACERKCNQHYHLTGNECAIDMFQFTLVENEHVNTLGSTETGKKPYDSKIELKAESYTGYRFMGWQIVGLNGTGISHTSVNNQIVFNMPDRDVTATPLTSLIDYDIMYNNVEDAQMDNPSTYNIETQTFTLNEPIRTGYTFLGWTGSNGLEPEKEVILTKGNYGNKKYNAVWEPKSGIKYTVVHAVEKVNSTSYEERETEMLTGTTDELTEAVAKFYTGFTAKEINQKVIKGDGSTVVRVQYKRNIYTITFDSNGGSEILPITGKYESDLTVPSNPTKTGYIFNGWNPSFPSRMPLGGMDLVAQWRLPSGGGSSSSEESQVTTGENETSTGQIEISTGTKIDEVIQETENLDISMDLMKNMLKMLNVPRSVGSSATLLPGDDFLDVIVGLAGDSDNITQILYTGSMPAGATTGLVSIQGSIPVMAGYLNEIIYLTTEANEIYLNEDSSGMFSDLSSVTKIDTTKWNTSNVQYMNYMFYDCSSLTELSVSGWNTSDVTTMEGMFMNCSSLIGLDVSNWNVGNVECMTDMFSDCSSLTELNVNDWNMSNVTATNQLLKGCSSLIELDVSNWNTSNIIDMESMFDGCSSLQTIYASSGFVTTAVTSFSNMFNGCTSLVGGNGTTYNSSKTDAEYARIDAPGTPGYFTALKTTTLLSGRDFNQTIKRLAGNSDATYDSGNTTITQVLQWTGNSIPNGVTTGVLSVEDSDYPVYGWYNNGIIYYYTDADKIYMNENSNMMFAYMHGLTELDLSNWDASSVINMGYMFYSGGNLTSLDISNWDTSSVQNMNGLFYGLRSIENLDISNWDTSSVTGLYAIFAECESLTSLDVSNWNTSNVVDMSYVFRKCSSLTNLDISNWDTSNVISMVGMFTYCYVLEGLDVSNFDTSKVTDMTNMFNSCRNLTGLDVSNFDTSSVTGMRLMFYDCENLKELDVSNWNTSKVTDMYAMFYSGINLTSLDVSNWKTSKVTNMSRMFGDCINLKTIYASTGFVTTKVGSNDTNMFIRDAKLVGGNGTKCGGGGKTYAKIDRSGQIGYFTDKKNITVNFLLDGNIYENLVVNYGDKVSMPVENPVKEGASFEKWIDEDIQEFDFDNNVIEKYTEIYAKFSGNNAILLPGKEFNVVLKKLSGQSNPSYETTNTTIKQMKQWTGNSVPNGVTTGIISVLYSDKEVVAWYDSGTIYYYTQADKIYTNTNSSYMFNSCRNLTGLDVSIWDTSKATDMTNMFAECYELENIDVSNWDTSNVTNMGYMFTECYELENIDVSNWDTSSVQNMNGLFYRCKKLTEIDLSNWDTSNVTSMYNMFACCHELENIDVSNWDTSNVTDMGYMFSRCKKLTEIDLSDWDTSNVTDMGYMFYDCTNLQTIYASTGFVTTNVTNSSLMFYNNTKLVGGNGTRYNSSSDKTYARIDKSGQPGYFTEMKIVTLLPGDEFNQTIKRLAGNNSATYNTTDTSIIQILPWGGNSIPSGVVTSVLSITGSEYPVYGWFSNGTIYYYTQADKIYMNENSIHMFSKCAALENLDIGDWKTDRVTDISYIFNGCNSLESVDLSSWDTSSVTNMSQMFKGCSNLETIYVSSNFDTSSLSTGDDMFLGCSSLVGGEGTIYDADYVDEEYARIDGKNGLSGYFTEMKKAILLPGKQFNQTIKRLAGNNSATYNTTDTSIIQIFPWGGNSIPSGVVTSVLSIAGSQYPVYGWYDNGTIYYYTQADKIYMNKDSSYMFYNCRNLTGLDVSNWDTSSVTNMQSMFSVCSKLIELDVSNWDTSSVTNMQSMFSSCINLRTIYASIGFVTTAITSASNGNYMFNGDTKLAGGNGTKYDSSKIHKTYAKIDNQSQSGYFTAKEGDLLVRFMVYPDVYESQTVQYGGKATRPTNNPTKSGFEFKRWVLNGEEYDFANNVIDRYTEIYATFNSDDALLLPGSEFRDVIVGLAGDYENITQVLYTGSMPEGATTGEVSVPYSDNAVIAGYKDGIIYLTTEADKIYLNQNSSFMFDYLEELVFVDTTKWDTSKVENMEEMFAGCYNLTELDVSNFDTSNVINMNYMFGECSSLTGLDVSNWDTSSVEDMGGIFSDCSSLEEIDVSNWDTTKVTDMNSMFAYCNSLAELDVTNWNTSKVTDMNSMFAYCNSLTELNLSNWDTSKVTNMSSMFEYCSNLAELDISNWDTSNVIEMMYMFYNCRNLTGLNLKGWDTSSVTNMRSMFRDADNLQTIYVSSKFDTSSLNTADDMFLGCSSLVGGEGTTYDADYVDDEYARIDGKDGLPGYFTEEELYTITYGTSSGNLYDSLGNHPKSNIVNYSPKDDLTLYTNFRSGYVFNGWYVDVENSEGSWLNITGTITNMHIGTGHTGDVLLKYDSTRLDYTLFIDDTDCSVDATEFEVFYGKRIDAEGTTLEGEDSLPIPTKTGYNFKGYSKSSGSNQLILRLKNGKVSTNYVFNDGNFEVDHTNRTSTIYPVFDVKKYTIVYHDNVNGNSNVSNIPYGSGVTLLNPQSDHHVFLGWYTSETGDLVGTGGSYFVIDVNQTPIHLYARWACESGYVAIDDACMPEFGDIDVYFVGDGSEIQNIKMMDRNLGAIMTGAGEGAATGSYGYHYQWGNNHGFEPCYSNGCDSFPGGEETTEAQVNLSEVYNDNPSTYSYRKFVSGDNNSWNVNDSYTNLWGGGDDDEDNNRGAEVTNPEERQGPCPDGYHVPSKGELENIVIFYGHYGGDSAEDFNIPGAGYRTERGFVSEQADGQYFWSSSPYSDNNPNSRYAYGYLYDIDDVWGRSNALSVRCFANSDLSGSDITIHPNGGKLGMIIVEGGKIKTLHDLRRDEDSVFEGWYSTSGFVAGSEVYEGDDAPTDLYAKWRCDTGYTDTGTGCVWYFEDLNVYFIDSGGEVSYVKLMDRNLGATTYDTTSTGSYGYHYQWGNNHGFQIGCWTHGCTDSLSTTMTKAIWNPSYENKGYNGTKYIISSYYDGGDYWTGRAHYDGLRGGSGDSEDNNRGLDTMTSSNITNRQGPCPDGYHVPSRGEWKNHRVYDWWYGIPNAGYRYNNNRNIIYDIKYDAYVWSSSPYSGNQAWAPNTFDGWGSSFYYMRYNGLSVRCFSNDYLFDDPSMVIYPNGGTGNGMLVVIHGDIVKELETPKRANSTFQGWYSDSGFTMEVATGDTAPANLYARWSCDTGYTETGTGCTLDAYTITYNLNGGTNNANNPSTYTVENGDIILQAPTKTGYTFKGWTGANGNIPQTGVIIAAGSYGNKTYNAVWTENTNTLYTVKYYTHNLAATTYKLDSTKSLSGTTNATVNVSDLVKFITGYTFEAAYVTGTTTKPSAGAVTSTTILPDGSRVINLYYRPNYLFVQYAMNGGYLGTHGSAYSVNGSLITATTNTLSGTTKFLRGLYGGKVGDVTLNNYTSNGASGLHNYNNSSAINILRTGYYVATGSEWNSQADGLGTSYNHATTTYTATGFAGASLDNGDAVVTVYVNWKPVEYTIIYNLNGGTNNASNPSKYTIESGAITLQQPTKVGYTFKGWTGSNGTAAQTSVTIAAGSYGDKTYNAVWQANTYYISYNNNGGAGSMTNTTCTYDSDCTLSSNTFTRTGYTFKGWSTSSSATSATYTNGQSVSNLTTTSGTIITLYAVWKDETKPVGTITTTNGANQTSQTATLNCTDGVGVTKYYWGINSSPAESTYIIVSPASTDYTVTTGVSASGTYYFFCKDAAGNVSTGKSITYNNYTVQNMLDTVAGTQGTYNTSNYATNGSVQGTYLVQSGTVLPLNNSSQYGDPIAGNDLYAGWTTADSGTPTYTNPTITANSTYYRWFNRTYLDLELKAGTGISSVNVDSQLPAGYTRVAYIGGTSSKARFNTNVAGGSNDLVIEAKIKFTKWVQYGYFWGNYVNESTNATRLIHATSTGSIYRTLNQKAGGGSPYNSSFAVNTWHVVKTYKENAVPKLNLDGNIQVGNTQQGTSNNGTIGFNANKSASPNGAASINQFEYLRIYDKGILIRNYVPCKNSAGVYGIYDLVNGTWNPSVGSNQFTGGPEVTGRGVYKYGATPTITATPNTASGYVFSGWTVNAGNTPASTTAASTTVTLTQNTILTANAKDNTNPVCTWGEPSKTPIKAGVTGSIILTCTDAVGVQTTLGTGDITISGAYLTIETITAGGTATNKTYTIVYKGKEGVNGLSQFVLPANKVKDAAGNSADTTGSNTVLVDNSAPTKPTFEAIFNADGTSYINGTWTNKQVDTIISTTDDDTVVKLQYRKEGTDTWSDLGLSIGALSNSGTLWTGAEAWTLQNRDDVYYFRAVDEAGNISEESDPFNIKYDVTKPVASITSTATINSTSQTATIRCTDNVGVVAYYRGKSQTPSLSDYRSIDSTTSFSGTKTVSDGYRYRLYCKDSAGNISAEKSYTYRSYRVYSYLDKITGTTGVYNTTNYANQGVNGYYTIPYNTSVPLADAYIQPTCSTYRGWSSTISPTSLSTEATMSVNEANFTRYAWFDRNTFDLTLSVGTGIESVAGAGNYKYEASIPISAVVKTGYTWSGWTNTAGSGLTTFTSATKDQSVVLACGPTTLKANATLNTYTITYNLNGGTNNANNPTTYTVENGAITLQDPTKVGFTFVGWTGANGNIPQTGVIIPSGSYGNKTYNATWQANTYNINYILSGGSHGTNHPTSATYDTAFTVNNPTREGYTFAGWKITGMDSVTHTYGTKTTTSTSISSTKETSFKNLHSTSGATVTFEALWTINQYNVTASVNEEGWGTLTDNFCATILYDKVSTISRSWDYLSPIVINGSIINIGGNQGTINQNQNAGNSSLRGRPPEPVPEPGSPCGTLHTIQATPTTSTAQYTYAFSGWNNECGDTVTHDCTIVAEFTRTVNNYDVTFNSNGGTPTPATQSIAYGSKATKPSNPSKTGYSFGGWTLNGNDFDFNTTITGAITLVAKRVDDIKPTFTVSNTSVNESQNLTINISASDNGEGLHDQAYSCNGGSTWSSTASCNMGIQNEPTTGSVIIQVRDNAGNITGMTVNYQWKNTAPINVNITNNGSTGECKPITYTASATDTGATMNYQWYAGANCTNAISNAISQTYTHTLNNKGTYSVYVKVSDSQGSGTCSVVNTATWTDVVLTAYNFTGHENVGNTGKTVNWKELSDANAGSCESITASLKTDASHGSCVVNGNNITYSPADNYEGDDTCVITLTDGDTNKDITVKWKEIDTTKPTCSISQFPLPSQWRNQGVTLTATVTERNPDQYSWTGWDDMSVTNFQWYIYENGSKTFYVKDVAGNTGSCSIIVDNIDTQSPTGTIQINNNATYTSGANVTLTLSANDTGGAGMGKMQFSCGVTWSQPELYATTKIRNLNTGSGCESGDGTKIVKVRFIDNAGNVSEVSDTIILDTVAPSGTLSLNNGADYTNNARVSIAMNASGGVSGMGKMRFGCDGSHWENWMNYGTDNRWTFSNAYTSTTACTSEDGTKTLYVQYMDNAGNVFTTSDTIILDTVPPIGSILLDNGAEYTNNAQGKVSIALSGFDALAGLSLMSFSCDGNNWSAWKPFNTTETRTFQSAYGCTPSDGEKTLYVEYQDNAGNRVRFSDTIILDRVAPILSFTDDVSATYVQTDTITVDWGEATTKKWRYSDSSACTTTESDYDKTDSDSMLQTTQTNNGRYICLYAKDAAGNVSTKASENTIHIDIIPPTGTLQINNGATYTSGANVTLTLSANDSGGAGMGKMRFSCNGSNWSTWENYGTSKSWNLNTGNGCSTGDGEKIVWVHYRDNAGTPGNTTIVTGKIILDTIAPNPNGGHGAALSGFVNSGSTIEVPLDIVELIGMNTGDFMASDIHVYVNGVEKQPNKTLTYNSEILGIYNYVLELSNLTGDGELKIVVSSGSFTDIAGNPNDKLEWSLGVEVDNTIPTCNITYIPEILTNENVTLTVNYQVEKNQINEGYSWDGNVFTENKINIVSDNGIYTGYVKDAAENIGSCNIEINNIDKGLPEITLNTTDTQKSGVQRLTGVCTDTVGITQYYIGNSSTPSYVTIPSTGIFVTGMDITSAGTYYLYCKDDAGNVISGSKTYDSYTVYNMLETITGTQGIYNMINYAVVSSGTYIAPRQTILTLSDIYTLPQYASVDLYKGYSTSNTTVSPNTSSSVMLNGAITYYAWFDRDRYTLDVIMNTGIDVIGYNVNGTDTYSMTQSTLTDIEIKAGSEIRAYAIPKVGYTYTETSESNPWIEIATGNMVFSPMATTNTNTQYVVYHYVKKVGLAKYQLAQTDTGVGMTDDVLVLSGLSKENEFPCAHYDRGSLTGTEDGPGEVVTQTTIKGDGSTKIYLYYTRNNRRVILSGDAHIESLEIDGNESTEAVRECGGEVPIKAKPKPGYHFVRWDRDREESEEGDNEGTSDE